MAKIYFVERAGVNLREIYKYSFEKYGNLVADEYLSKFDQAFSAIESNPELLLSKPALSDHYRFYLVGSHWLICKPIKEKIYVVTVLHTSLNIFKRLKELRPNLEREVENFMRKMKN